MKTIRKCRQKSGNKDFYSPNYWLGLIELQEKRINSEESDKTYQLLLGLVELCQKAKVWLDKQDKNSPVMNRLSKKISENSLLTG